MDATELIYAYDPTYILVLIGAVISLIASMNVSGTFKKYSRVAAASGISASEVAEEILKSAGIYDVRIEHVRGNLTDHYSPTEKVLRLSDSVYGASNVAAIGVAAHECGHAIQHQEEYAPLKLRAASVPLANIGSKGSWLLILVGLIMGAYGLARLGVFLFAFVVFFQLITLPVEFDASGRALRILEERSILQGTELKGARKVLKAAALTYVAALISSVLQFLRLVMLVQGRGRRR